LYNIFLSCRRVLVEQFGDRYGRVASPHRLCQLHDIALRHMGGLETGYAVDAVRMVQGRSVGCPHVRSSHLGGHRCVVVLGRRAPHRHDVHDRRRHYAHHVRRRTVRELGVSIKYVQYDTRRRCDVNIIIIFIIIERLISIYLYQWRIYDFLLGGWYQKKKIFITINRWTVLFFTLFVMLYSYDTQLI